MIESGLVYHDTFFVNDTELNPVEGVSEFNVALYNPNNQEVWSSQGSGIIELGSGFYRIGFTPNTTGQWIINVTNDTYFPHGKSQSYHCTDMFYRQDLIRGLVGENYILDTLAYNVDGHPTIGQKHTYIDKDLETGLATYKFKYTYNGDGSTESYKQWRYQ